MSKWQDKSDFDINKAVANKLGLFVVAVAQDGIIVSGKSLSVDYCNNPSDAWPIIVGNLISLSDPITVGYCDNWLASKTAQGEHFDCLDKNPLRAAMIVYLEMNGINLK